MEPAESNVAALAPVRTSKILICPPDVPAAKRCPSGWKAAVVNPDGGREHAY